MKYCKGTGDLIKHLHYLCGSCKNPTFSTKYTKDGNNLREGSYIVESDERFKIIDYYDLFNLRSDQYGNTHAESLALEQRVTNAIQYVIADKLPVIYTLKAIWNRLCLCS